jgi:hypothetical protein
VQSDLASKCASCACLLDPRKQRIFFKLQVKVTSSVMMPRALEDAMKSIK